MVDFSAYSYAAFFFLVIAASIGFFWKEIVSLKKKKIEVADFDFFFFKQVAPPRDTRFSHHKIFPSTANQWAIPFFDSLHKE